MCAIFLRSWIALLHFDLKYLMWGLNVNFLSKIISWNLCSSTIGILVESSLSRGSLCGPMLIKEPSVMWLQVRVLVAVVFATTTFASDCLLCQRCVLKDPHRDGGWHNSAGFSSDDQVIWVARLSSNSKNRENLLLTNNKNIFYWNTFVRQ